MKAMRNTINKIWESLEGQHGAYPQRLQRLIGTALLTRVYVGLEGIPSKRLLIIEIPEHYRDAFAKFVEPLGIAIDIENTGEEKQGFVSCVLQVLSSDLNDIFSIVVQDIINYLETIRDVEKYVKALQERVEKWKVFFQTRKLHVLSPQMTIGLFGELSFIANLKKAGYLNSVELWNGPLRASQDFQTVDFAAEVKTVVGSKINAVHISSVEQLDIGQRKKLFLIATRIELDDIHGLTLPELIDDVKSSLSTADVNKLMAKLVCLGYEESQKDRYDKKYSIKETFYYDVADEFPRIKKKDVHPSVFNITYALNLVDCRDFKVEFNDVLKTLGVKDNEYV